MKTTLALLSIAAPLSTAQSLTETGCFAPKSVQGGKGFCGPAECEAFGAFDSRPKCQMTGQAVDAQSKITQLGNQAVVCTQSSDPRCTSTALADVVKSDGSIQAAFCNDEWLVIASTGAPSWTPNLDDIPFAPGGEVGGVTCATGDASITPMWRTFRFPLSTTLLTTSVASNNAATKTNGGPFTGGAGADDGWMQRGDGQEYGLPTRGHIGLSIEGQEIYPLYNNRGELTPNSCEVDSCNEHVGQGGGEPHLHGDPFADSADYACLYSSADYASNTVHPPQIGWAVDGLSIYGRHIHAENEGYTVALDDCGGHTHGDMQYHYHAQVISGTTPNNDKPNSLASNVQYYLGTPGVFQCLKGDLSQVGGNTVFDQQAGEDTSTKPCSGMTHYYLKTGITMPNVGTQNMSNPTPSPAPTPSTTPTPSPAPTPTLSPTPTPTPTPSPENPTPTPTPASEDCSSYTPQEVPGCLNDGCTDELTAAAGGIAAESLTCAQATAVQSCGAALENCDIPDSVANFYSCQYTALCEASSATATLAFSTVTVFLALF